MSGKRRSNRKTDESTGKKSTLVTFLKELLLLLCVVLVINSFVLASFEVPTGSMEDTVAIGDRVFVNKFLYGGSTPYTIPLTSIRIPHIRVPGFRDVARGDVIVFDWPGSRDQVEKPRQMWYLKRCIGLPGDTIQIQNQVVYVNGRMVPDPPHAKHLRAGIFAPGMANPCYFPARIEFQRRQLRPDSGAPQRDEGSAQLRQFRRLGSVHPPRGA